MLNYAELCNFMQVMLRTYAKVGLDPRFSLQYDFELEAPYLQSLKIQNICCTFGDWVRLGRLPESMCDQRNI